ncbi:MAG: conjugal transfer transcriptional regulator TraJ [Burkholderia sp.]
MQDKATRKGSPPIKVYCLPDERAQVQAKADAAGLSLSAYLLRVGMGYEIQGILDHRRVHDLAKVNGDLGRLGGLLKLWLTNDARTAGFTTATIRTLLAKIEATQDDLREVMTKVVRG